MCCDSDSSPSLPAWPAEWVTDEGDTPTEWRVDEMSPHQGVLSITFSKDSRWILWFTCTLSTCVWHGRGCSLSVTFIFYTDSLLINFICTLKVLFFHRCFHITATTSLVAVAATEPSNVSSNVKFKKYSGEDKLLGKVLYDKNKQYWNEHLICLNKLNFVPCACCSGSRKYGYLFTLIHCHQSVNWICKKSFE